MKIGIDYIGVSAGAVIVNSDGKYFLAKRAEGARDDIGKWEFPGGTVNFCETREDAAYRNMKEKHNIDIQIQSILGVYDVTDEVDKDHWVSTTYLCTLAPGSVPEITNSEKCSEIGWFSPNELQDLDLSRISLLNLRDLASGKVFSDTKLKN